MSNNLKIKSDKLSRNFIEVGKNFFMNGNFEDALIYCNKALCYAESEEHLVLAYGNRSAVYCELKLYNECLQNIKWAKENGYPSDKMAKLNEREAKCIKKKEAITYDPSEDPMEFFKLSHPPNPKIPFIVDCIEMKKNSKFGRGIYATRDLKPGDFIAIEESQIRLLYPIRQASYLFCANCLKSCMHNLIPCTKSASFMFCSEECCQLLNSSGYKQISQEKIFAEMLDNFGSRENLLKFIKETDFENFDVNIFDFDLSDPSHPDYGQNLIKCFLSSGRIYNAFGIKIHDSVDRAPIPTHITQGDEDVASFMKQMLRNFDLEADRLQHGALISSFGCLLNPFNRPNVKRVYFENKIAYYVRRPVKAGEELFERHFSSDKSLHTYFERCAPNPLPSPTLRHLREKLITPWTMIEKLLNRQTSEEAMFTEASCEQLFEHANHFIEIIASMASTPFGFINVFKW